MSTPTPTPGLAPAPVGSASYAQNVQDAIDAYARQQQASLVSRAQQPADGGFLPDWLMRPIEYVGSKMYAVWRPVARVITTPMLAAQIGKAEYGSGEKTGVAENFFDGDTWDRAWRDAKHVSPGQAIYQLGAQFGKTPVETFKALNKGQPDGSLIWDNPDNVQHFFDHGSQKFISGGLDAAVSWYADPFVMAGKVAGVASRAAYVRPLITTRKATLGRKAFEKITAPLPERFQYNASKVTIRNPNESVMDSFAERIMKAHKANPDGIEAWVSNQPWAKNSPDGMALANAIGKGARRGRDELNLVLRTSMGDEGAYGLLRSNLTANNPELAAQVEGILNAQKSLPKTLPSNPGPSTLAVYGQMKTYYAGQMAAIEREQNFLKSAIAAKGSISELRFNAALTPLAERLGEFGRNFDRAMVAKAESVRGKSFASRLVYNNLYVRPVRMIGGIGLLGIPAFTRAKDAWTAIRPNGWVGLHDSHAYREVDAQLQQAKAFTPAERQAHVSDFIKINDPSQRGAYLVGLETKAVERIAGKYGMDEQSARTVYAELAGARARVSSGRIYSTATIDMADGTKVPIDSIGDSGELVVAHPVLNSQLENTHVMMDFEHINKVLKANGPALQRLIQQGAAAGEAATAIKSGEAGFMAAASYKAMKSREALSAFSGLMGSLWKFNVLLRVGYGPRAISDDFLGQIARFGAYTMFMERTAKGSGRGIIRGLNNAFNDPTMYHAQRAGLEGGIQAATERVAYLEGQAAKQAKFLPPNVNAPTTRAGRRAHAARHLDIQSLRRGIDEQHQIVSDVQGRLANLDRFRAQSGKGMITLDDGTAIPAAFEGSQGNLFKDLNSGRRTIDTMLGGTGVDLHNFLRNGDWKVMNAVREKRSDYIGSWLRDVQRQIANDKAAMAVVRGENLRHWFTTAEGQAYRQASPYKNLSSDLHADRIESHVDKYLPTLKADGSVFKEGNTLRLAVAKGLDDGRVRKLMDEMYDGDGMKFGSASNIRELPDIQGEGLAYVLGTSHVAKMSNDMINRFYHVMNQIPSEVLSRNPLFKTLYRSHAQELQDLAKSQGLTHLNNRQIQELAEQARKRALRDVKKFTFNMDHETQLAHTMRFVAPFFGPMQESFNRWGRIMAEKPEVAGHFVQAHTAPIRGGYAFDAQGNKVDSDGYATDAQGNRKLVPKNEMHVRFQVPDWMAKALGGKQIDMPIDTLNLVLQNDPWYNPGTGPWVQMSANEIAKRTDPRVGDLLTKTGILPLGVQQSTTDAIKGSLLRNLDQVMNPENNDRINNIWLQSMQSEEYKWRSGLRDTEPTAKEIDDKVRHFNLLKGLMNFIAPVSYNATDQYQFFRDQYHQLQQANPNTADEVFYDRYGDAAFAFTASLSKNKTGLPATVKAIAAKSEWRDMIYKYPELTGLIAGPDASGTFSQTAFRLQQFAGDRVKLSPGEALSQAKANEGWVVFMRQLKGLKAQLVDRGLQSFTDPGAEDLLAYKKATVETLSEPYMPDGATPNPQYNPDWTTQYKTIDLSKDTRLAAAMDEIAQTKELNQANPDGSPQRPDIAGLGMYMAARHIVTQELAARKAAGGSGDINANENEDLRQIFMDNISSLTEQNLAFEVLHNRWLSRDMFDHFGG